MREILALARRILQQFAHDKRTIAMFIVGPILVLWLFSVLLGAGAIHPKIVCINLPTLLTDALAEEDATLEDRSLDDALDALAAGEIDGVLTLKDGTLTVQVEGSNPARTGAVIAVVQPAIKAASVTQRDEVRADVEGQIDDIKTQADTLKSNLDELYASLETLKDFPKTLTKKLAAAGIPPAMMPDIDLPEIPDVSANASDFALPDFGSINLDIQPLVDETEISYLHGNDSWDTFDFFGPVFIGIFIFIFVFITSGMSLVTERTGGTMERLLVTPIKPYQLVCGFCLGFGAVTILQAIIVLWACVSLIGFPNEGLLIFVVLVTFSMALVSMTLGLLVSAVAKTPFQVIQFMLILVVPQVLLSGIFDLSNCPAWMQVLSRCFPITYGAEALRDIMLRGANLMETGLNFAVLWGFLVVFFLLATLSFKRRKTR